MEGTRVDLDEPTAALLAGLIERTGLTGCEVVSMALTGFDRLITSAEEELALDTLRRSMEIREADEAAWSPNEGPDLL